MALSYPPIPLPGVEPEALRETSLALKETAEILTGVRGDRGLSAVTWNDLVTLGLILPSQIPLTIGNR